MQGKHLFDTESGFDAHFGSEPDTDSDTSSQSRSLDDLYNVCGYMFDILCVSAAGGFWGLCHTFDGNLNFTRNSMKG